MNIGIVTQPLFANYGGYLQAWALQEKLRQMGHQPVTVDYLRKPMPWANFIYHTLRTFAARLLGRKRSYPTRVVRRSATFQAFVDKHFTLTRLVHSYAPELVDEYNMQAVITGSDQVWRPRFNTFLADMYLRFAAHSPIPRIAYAASFGVDNWEYTPGQTSEVRPYAQQLRAISVREHSGIALVEQHLGCNAIEVLDPTLLHSAHTYATLCADVPRATGRILLAYILDVTPQKAQLVLKLATALGLEPHICTADGGCTLSIQQWLAQFRDAAFVLTDSFHGTVFSIIHHRPFLSLVNESRGASRFHSLLAKFHLESRLITNPAADLAAQAAAPIPWPQVESTLQTLRQQSEQFLRNSLEP